VPELAAHHHQQFFSHQRQVVAVQVHVGQAGVHINADPFGPVSGACVLQVKVQQAIAQRHVAVLQLGDPVVAPLAQENRLEDRVDQVLPGREVAVQQRLRYTQAARELARLHAKTGFGEAADGGVKAWQEWRRRPAPCAIFAVVPGSG
jgi:hypothetical protein